MRSPLRCRAVFLSPLLALFASAAVPLRTARAQSAEHDAVRAVVSSLFDAMRTRDTAAMHATFDPAAVLQSIGPSGVTVDPVHEWLSSVAGARAGVVLDERLGPQQVQLDGAIASVWVPYHFFVGERFSHCGVDAFVLAKSAGSWRIISVADTRQREGCAPLPAP